MTLRKDITILLAALLTACSADHNDGTGTGNYQPKAQEEGITFAQPWIIAAGSGNADTDPLGGDTRAAHGTIDNDGTEGTALKSTTGFGVFGCYTGSHRYADSDMQPNFMYNEHIWWDGAHDVWTYSPIKYWPNGEGETLPDGTPAGTGNGTTAENPHYITFFAYGPYSDLDGSDPATNPAGYCIPSFSYQSEHVNPWLTYQLIPQAHLDKQVDLLCATPLIDQKKPQTNERLKFQMQHALACVAGAISVRCEKPMKENIRERLADNVGHMEVIITRLTIDYELTDHGRLTLWNNGTMNWEPVVSGNFTTKRTANYATVLSTVSNVVFDITGDKDDATVNTEMWSDDTQGIFYIPIHIGHHVQTATINLEYQVRHYTPEAPTVPIAERTRALTAAVTLSDFIEAYQAGKCLNFNLLLNETSLVVTAAIHDWLHGLGETIGDIHAE